MKIYIFNFRDAHWHNPNIVLAKNEEEAKSALGKEVQDVDFSVQEIEITTKTKVVYKGF